MVCSAKKALKVDDSTAAAAKPGGLPWLDVGELSISGISSGADLVVQLQVAFSNLVDGTGVFAGQAYRCAVTRFPLDNLSHVADASVPFCDGCPPNTTLGYDHCKRHPDVAKNVSRLVEYAKEQAAAGNVSSLQTLAKRKVFLYRGTKDTTYNKGAVQATADFFLAAGVPQPSLFFEKNIQSAHLVPTIDPYLCWWEEWSGPDNCTFDGARHVLEWVHGTKALAAGRDNRTQKLYGKQYLRDFDQTRYFNKDGRDALLADTAKVFVPLGCAKAGAKCNVHFFFHGCGVMATYEVFTQFAGFNEWAMLNNFVVVYPKMSNRGKITQMSGGCFDGYGDTGRDYALRSGPQMATVANMMRAIGKKPSR